MRTIKKPEIRKQEILKGALTVFLDKGYEKTTISDISRELGVSQGLCYRYFASKEEIYDAVIDTCAAMIVEANLQSRPSRQSIRQWLNEIPHMLQTMVQAEQANPQLYALLHHPQNQKMHRELCLRAAEQLLPTVTAVLEQASQAGEIQLRNCRQTAAFGLYGEIGLLLWEGSEAGTAIQEHWRRLLEIQ